ncbi:MAG: hypothetical protein EOO41_03780, partial [Methanobacteriota archaeon]
SSGVASLLAGGASVAGSGGSAFLGGAQPGVVIPHLTSVVVSNSQELLEVYMRGIACRATASTNIHEHSSRSHCVLRVEVEGTPLRFTGGDATGEAGGMLASTLGRLYLVDLAGSERVRKSAVTGARLREAQHINKSLAALGDVLEALDKRQPHIPFRNSKLTHLLQDALGGNARTLMMATVCPEHFTADETVFSLQFASRARNIDLGPAQRTVQFKNVTEQYRSLRADFVSTENARVSLAKEIEELTRDKAALEDKLNALREVSSKQSDQLRKAASTRLDQMKRDMTVLQEQLVEERKAKAALAEALAAATENGRREQHVVAAAERDKRSMEQRAVQFQREAAALRQQLLDLKASARRPGAGGALLAAGSSRGGGGGGTGRAPSLVPDLPASISSGPPSCNVSDTDGGSISADAPSSHDVGVGGMVPTTALLPHGAGTDASHGRPLGTQRTSTGMGRGGSSTGSGTPTSAAAAAATGRGGKLLLVKA